MTVAGQEQHDAETLVGDAQRLYEVSMHDGDGLTVRDWNRLHGILTIDIPSLAARLAAAEAARDAIQEKFDRYAPEWLAFELWQRDPDGGERLARMREALEFYADERTYTQPTSWGGRILDTEGPWRSDTGKRARAALAGVGHADDEGKDTA